MSSANTITDMVETEAKYRFFGMSCWEPVHSCVPAVATVQGLYYLALTFIEK